MADLSVPAPAEPQKEGEYLHDQARLPEPPDSRGRFGAVELFVIAATVLTVGLAALAFQTWAGWGNVRNLGLVIQVSVSAFAGVSLGYLLWRQRWEWAAPALIIVVVAAALVAMNLGRAAYVDGPDTLRDVLSVLTGITGAALIGYLVFAYFWVELTDPTRPPAPEM